MKNFFPWLFILTLLPSAAESQVFSVSNPPENSSRITGGVAGGQTGFALESINIDNVGTEDFFLGAPFGDVTYFIYRETSAPPKTFNLQLLGPTGNFIDGENNTSLGYSLASIGDMNRDGYPEIAIGAPFEGDGGRVYVMRGGPKILFSSVPTADLSRFLFIVEGTPGENLGFFLQDGGDFNYDALADLLIGSPLRATGEDGFNVGAAYIIYGRTTFTEKVLRTNNLDSASTLTVTAVTDSTETGQFGQIFRMAGDLTQDGLADAVLYTGLQQGGGEALVIPGGNRLTGTLPVTSITENALTYLFQLFPQPNMNSITALESGDVNKDGKVDLVVGFANGNVQGGTTPNGAIAIVPGSDQTSGTVTINTPNSIAVLGHTDPGSGLGSTISVFDSLIAAGAANATDPIRPNVRPGAAYIVSATKLQAGQVVSNIGQVADVTYIGRDTGDQFGFAVDFTQQRQGTYMLVSAIGDTDTGAVPVYLMPANPAGAAATPTPTPVAATPTPTPILPTATPTLGPTPTPPQPILADINRDGVVDYRDVYAFSTDWRRNAAEQQFQSDLAPDAAGQINALDLLRLIEGFQGE